LDLKRCLLGFLIVFAALPLRAEGGSTGLTFLRLSPFARSAGMAEATSAFVGESLAVYSNPAGLAHLSRKEISAHHVTVFEDTSYETLAFVAPHKRGGWGVSAGYLSVQDIPKTRFDPTSVDRFVENGEAEAGDMVAAFSFGWRQDKNLALGASVKAVQETLDEESAITGVVDAGMIYRFRYNRAVRSALVVQNLGPSFKFISDSVTPPTRLRGGLFYSSEAYALYSAEAIYNMGGELELLVGAEINWQKMAFLRAGYRYAGDTDLGALAGATFGVGLQAAGFGVDYAFLPFGDLGDSHRVSLSWQFGKR